jgi:hypothetical protein
VVIGYSLTSPCNTSESRIGEGIKEWDIDSDNVGELLKMIFDFLFSPLRRRIIS